MIYVEAPDEYEAPAEEVAVFLAGGITNCPDWQAEIRDLLADTELVLLNPRRSVFDMEDPHKAEEQITWEHRHFRKADRLLFWFPAATLCPIVLYELGAWSMTDKTIAIGIEPGYQREQDVVVQTRLVRPDVQIVDNLPDLADLVR